MRNTPLPRSHLRDSSERERDADRDVQHDVARRPQHGDAEDEPEVQRIVERAAAARQDLDEVVEPDERPRAVVVIVEPEHEADQERRRDQHEHRDRGRREEAERDAVAAQAAREAIGEAGALRERDGGGEHDDRDVAAIHACHSSAGTASAAMPANVPVRAARRPTSAPAAASAAPRPSTPMITSSG